MLAVTADEDCSDSESAWEHNPFGAPASLISPGRAPTGDSDNDYSAFVSPRKGNRAARMCGTATAVAVRKPGQRNDPDWTLVKGNLGDADLTKAIAKMTTVNYQPHSPCVPGLPDALHRRDFRRAGPFKKLVPNGSVR